MMALDHLRDYQRQAIDDLIGRWDAGATRVPMVLATGLGKTEIFTPLERMWIESLAEAYGLGRRVLVIAHTDELIEQAARKARLRNPGISVGIVKAGLNQAHAQIVISSRQTLASQKRRAAITNVGLIIIDECHHALRSNTYGKILEHFGAFDEQPRVKVAGFTATLVRSDKGKLSSVWEECTFRRDILFGIRRGYLLDVRGTRVVVPDLSMSNVKTKAGDYQDASIAEELERTFAPQIIAAKYAEVARDARGDLRLGIAFWPLVETAYHGAESFESAGIPSAVVHGGLPREERRLILKKFHEGEIKVVHNCMVLTEGFDEPRADVVVIARPTKSPGLYQQMVGRVLRPDLTVAAGDRDKALILDVVGASVDHDLCSLIDLSPERPFKGDPEDLSLLELDDDLLEYEETHAGEFADPTWVAPHDGPVAVVEFDPLHRARTWDQTPGGTFYIPAGTDAYVFLAPSVHGDPGHMDVVTCSQAGPGDWRRRPVWARLTDCTDLEQDEALLAAEDVSIELGGGSATLTTRKSAWRKAKPSQAQLSKAVGIGLRTKLEITGWRDDPAGFSSPFSKGEVSDAINHVEAGRRIDPLVRTVLGGA